jgi:hypothetical protein
MSVKMQEPHKYEILCEHWEPNAEKPTMVKEIIFAQGERDAVEVYKMGLMNKDEYKNFKVRMVKK